MSSEWRPIETAPKDGSEVLIAGPLYNDISNGLYRAVAYYRDGAWYENEDSSPDENLWDPIYWMPIPEVPVVWCNLNGSN